MTQNLEAIEDLSGFFNGLFFLAMGLFISWGTLWVRKNMTPSSSGKFWALVHGSTAVLGCSMITIAGFLWWCDPIDLLTDALLRLGYCVWGIGMITFCFWVTTDPS